MKSYIPLLLLLGLICQSSLAIRMNSKTGKSVRRMSAAHGFWHDEYGCFLNLKSASFLSSDSSQPDLVKMSDQCGTDETLWMWKDHPNFPGFHAFVNKKYPDRLLDIWSHKSYLNANLNASGTKLLAYQGLLFRGAQSLYFLSASSGSTSSQSSGDYEKWRMFY